MAIMKLEAYLFSKGTGLFWGVKDLVEEDREVKGQTQAYGVCGLHFCLAYIECFLVSILRVFYGCCRKKNDLFRHAMQIRHTYSKKATPLNP